MSDPYDPQASDERRSGSQYVTRRDVRLVGIVLAVLALAAWPVYMYMLRQVNSSTCNRNLRRISEALLAYAHDNEEHLPFAYETNGYGSSEIAVHNGYAYTWQWVLEAQTSDWSMFRCPAADASEHSKSADPWKGEVESSDYGMLNAYSGQDLSTVSEPGQKIIIGETANRGAMGSYDPLPLLSQGKPIADDGNFIGFDNSQDYPDAKTAFATRLAFRGTSSGHFDRNSEARHPDGDHFLTLDGHRRGGDGAIAEVIQQGGYFGPWDVPKPARRVSPNTLKP